MQFACFVCILAFTACVRLVSTSKAYKRSSSRGIMMPSKDWLLFYILSHIYVTEWDVKLYYTIPYPRLAYVYYLPQIGWVAGGRVALKWAAEDREGWRHRERMLTTCCTAEDYWWWGWVVSGIFLLCLLRMIQPNCRLYLSVTVLYLQRQWEL